MYKIILESKKLNRQYPIGIRRVFPKTVDVPIIRVGLKFNEFLIIFWNIYQTKCFPS
jgi:hypothetical protein